MTSLSDIYFEVYDSDSVGLKRKNFDEMPHGVPEGEPDQWRDVIDCLRYGIDYCDTRLAIDAGVITSPRNTHKGEEFVFSPEDADALQAMLIEAQRQYVTPTKK